MVAAVNTQASQAFTLAGVEGNNLQVFQTFVLAATAYPAEGLLSSQAFVLAGTASSNIIEVYQSFVLAAVIGRVFDPAVRVWTYTLDGHDFYILKCGNTETLVYDTLSKEWSIWGTEGNDLWRAYNGTNWDGGNLLAAGYGSNVVVGDDGNGALYFLDPNGTMDDDALVGQDNPHPFLREISAAIPHHGRRSAPIYGISITGSIGDVADSTLNEVTLQISDDRGNNYEDCGTVTVTQDSWNDRLEWRSLGRMEAPGRLFRIQDYGALKRIDGIELTGDSE